MPNYNYKYSFYNFINYNWKLRKQLNYNSIKTNHEKTIKLKIKDNRNRFKKYNPYNLKHKTNRKCKSWKI